jgi:hypothetical protein
MRGVRIILLGLLVAVPSGIAYSEGDRKALDELEWARGVADDF